VSRFGPLRRVSEVEVAVVAGQDRLSAPVTVVRARLECGHVAGMRRARTLARNDFLPPRALPCIDCPRRCGLCGGEGGAHVGDALGPCEADVHAL